MKTRSKMYLFFVIRIYHEQQYTHLIQTNLNFMSKNIHICIMYLPKCVNYPHIFMLKDTKERCYNLFLIKLNYSWAFGSCFTFQKLPHSNSQFLFSTIISIWMQKECSTNTGGGNFHPLFLEKNPCLRAQLRLTLFSFLCTWYKRSEGGRGGGALEKSIDLFALRSSRILYFCFKITLFYFYEPIGSYSFPKIPTTDLVFKINNSDML